MEQTFKYSINRLIKFTKCSACLIFPGTASVRKKKRNVVDNFPGILMDKCITVNIFQTSEECFSSSNSIEIYCNGVCWHNRNMTKRCQSEQKNHPQKNSVHWTCTLDFVVI